MVFLANFIVSASSASMDSTLAFRLAHLFVSDKELAKKSCTRSKHLLFLDSGLLLILVVRLYRDLHHVFEAGLRMVEVEGVVEIGKLWWFDVYGSHVVS